MLGELKNNIAVKILTAASEGHYGVPGVCCYNLETIAAVKAAAESRSSPCQILLFPWSLTYADGLLVTAASEACRTAKVPDVAASRPRAERGRDSDVLLRRGSLIVLWSI